MKSQNQQITTTMTLSLVGVNSIFEGDAIAAAVVYSLKKRSCGWQKLKSLLDGQEVEFNVPPLVANAKVSLCYTKDKGATLLNVSNEDFTLSKGEKWAVDGKYFNVFRPSSYLFDLKDEVDQNRFHEAFEHIVKVIRENPVEDFGIKKLKNEETNPENADSAEKPKAKKFSEEALFKIKEDDVNQLVENAMRGIEAVDAQLSDEIPQEFFRLIRAMLNAWGKPATDRDVFFFIMKQRGFKGGLIKKAADILYPPQPKEDEKKEKKTNPTNPTDPTDPEKGKGKGNLTTDPKKDKKDSADPNPKADPSPAGGADDGDDFEVVTPKPKPQKPEPVVPVKRLMEIINEGEKKIPKSLFALVGVKEAVTISEANEFLAEAGSDIRLNPRA